MTNLESHGLARKQCTTNEYKLRLTCSEISVRRPPLTFQRKALTGNVENALFGYMQKVFLEMQRMRHKAM